MPTVRVSPAAIVGVSRSYVHIAARLWSLKSPKVEPFRVLTVKTRGKPTLFPPFLHDSIVTIHEVDGSSLDFLICFLHSPDLPVNNALLRLYPGLKWRGELVVIRKSPRSIVTAVGGRVCAGLAEEAIIAYVIHLFHGSLLLIEGHASDF
ncbi:hypothetical protein FA95DRAFT_1577666 [Auriscalpium vulgare]|uniref:Uncharacterized protein n=1 Tax=Auriscalpium vulgare TaxID=40419 RepID=A0ACB8R5C4_9AGAM|nr:hypothetical protein FA95DRAFT_1577666 [Auriscalpium vulgare]